VRVDLIDKKPASIIDNFAPVFLSQTSRMRTHFDRSERLKAYQKASVEGDPETLSRNNIEPNLLVDSFELEFERDKKGDKISLGRGAFGNVLVADYHGTTCVYKEIMPSALSPETLKRFFFELKLIGKLRHPNIAQCLGVVWEAEDHGILFELCKNGGIDDFMKKYEKYELMSWKDTDAVKAAQRKVTQNSTKNGVVVSMLLSKGIGIKAVWALEVAKGCAYLHGKNPPIVHRDLKGANVLVANDLSAKITDFGESRHLGGEGEEDQKTITQVGTPHFMAPEVFSTEYEDRMYSKQVDIYSYGMFLLEMFHEGRIMRGFKKGWGQMVIMNRVSKGWRPDLKLVMEEDEELADIMNQCWQHKPDNRPTFKELIKFWQKKLLKMKIATIKNDDSSRNPSMQEEEKPKTVEQNKKDRLPTMQPIKRSTTAEAVGPIDPLGIFAMAKEYEKKEAVKRDAEIVATVKIDPEKALFAMAAGTGGEGSWKEEQKQKAEAAKKKEEKEEDESLTEQQRAMKVMMGKQDFWLL